MEPASDRSVVVEVVVLSSGERRAAVAAMVAAFWDYPETVHLLPDERKRRHVLPRYLAGDCGDSLLHSSLLGIAVDGEVAGAAAWLPPEAYPIPLRRQLAQVATLVPALPWGIGAAREARRGQSANRARHPHEPHCFLRAVGVSPRFQGRGIGAALIEHQLERSDLRGVGCYLTTAKEANVAFYARFGFEITDAYKPTATWPTVWAMWRPPRHSA